MSENKRTRANDTTAEAVLSTRRQQAMKEENITCIVAPAVASDDSQAKYGISYVYILVLLNRQETLLSFAYARGCCLLVDKTVLQGELVFDPAFFMYCEDACLCWRLQWERRILRETDRARVYHESDASSQKAGLFYEYHTTRGHILMTFMSYRFSLEIPLMLTCRFFSLSLMSLARCIRYRSPVPARAFLLAWYPARQKLN